MNAQKLERETQVAILEARARTGLSTLSVQVCQGLNELTVVNYGKPRAQRVEVLSPALNDADMLEFIKAFKA